MIQLAMNSPLWKPVASFTNLTFSRYDLKVVPLARPSQAGDPSQSCSYG